MHKKIKYSESIFCPPSRSSNSFSNSSFDHFTRWAGTIAKAVIFFISAPLGSMLTAEGMRGRDGSSEGIPNQFVSSAAEGLIAVCSMKKRECSGDWRDSCDRFTGGIWESIPSLGSHSHPERWPHTSHPSAGISTPTHLGPFRMCSQNTSALYRNTSASARIGQKQSFFWVRQQEGKMC